MLYTGVTVHTDDCEIIKLICDDAKPELRLSGRG